MSQFSVFFLPHRGDGSAADELNGFLRSHRIVHIERYAMADGWSFCVEWTESRNQDSQRGLRFPEKIDYMKELPPPVFAVFSKLRVKRKELAKDAGIPSFGIATDAQLAQMAKLVNPTLADLGKIDGFGEARIRDFGQKLLSALEGAGSNESDETDRKPL